MLVEKIKESLVGIAPEAFKRAIGLAI